MNDELLEASIRSLGRQSRTSLILVLIGTAFLFWSVYYSASRLRPLEQEIAARKSELTQLAQQEAAQRARLVEMQRSFDLLKKNTESLYSVKVTKSNAVYEVKASAVATGKMMANRNAEYRFSIFINSAPDMLKQIEQVAYVFDHASFVNKEMISTDRDKAFAKSYVGWGCLSSVKVRITWKSGKTEESDFDMCRSLGPEWQ